MGQNTGENRRRGLSIELPVPLPDESLYAIGCTDAVLEFLARHRFDSVTQTELAAQVDRSESSVQRAVDVLAANDLVEVAYDGTRKHVRIDRQRLSVPDDPYLQIPQSEFQAPVKAAVERLREDLDEVIGIVLYGSVARGEADRRSDVDLWIVVRGDRAETQRRANDVVVDLEEERFEGERYEFHVAVETLESIPAFTEDVAEILRSGIPMHDSEQFRTLRELLMEEVDR